MNISGRYRSVVLCLLSVLVICGLNACQNSQNKKNESKMINGLSDFSGIPNGLSEYGLSPPRIEENKSMKEKQQITYDCIWFGNYPQTEVVCKSDTTRLAALKQMNEYYQTEYEIVDIQQWEIICGAKYNGDGMAEINGIQYCRRLQSEARYVGTASCYYDWEGGFDYHYFKIEPVKWKVLAVDSNEAILWSDIGLDAYRYHESYKNVSWEESTMRNWLNGYNMSDNFIDHAFSKKEKSAIVPANVEGNISDKIYLLSEEEVTGICGFDQEALANDEARQIKSSTYAKAMGSMTSTLENYEGNCYWWLRSSGFGGNVRCVLGEGCVNEGGAYTYSEQYAVLPTLHLNLSYEEVYFYAGTVSTNGTVNECVKK